MVVRLIFKHEKPVFLHAVHVNLDFDGTGVDLLRFVEVRKLAFAFKLFCTEYCEIHQCDRFIGTSLIQYLTRLHISLEGLVYILVCNRHIVNLRQKRGVTAVIRPVGVNHADLCNSRVTALGVAEICLTKRNVV